MSSVDVLPARRLSENQIAGWAASEWENVENRAYAHETAARRWDNIAKSGSLIVAFTAAISTLSIFADNKEIAAIFALVTAAVGALQASFDPARTAKEHRDAALGYSKWLRTIADIATVVTPNPDTSYDPGTGLYYDSAKPVSLSEDELAQINQDRWDCFRGIGEVDAKAPSISWSRVWKQRQREYDEYLRATKLRSAGPPEWLTTAATIPGTASQSPPPHHI
jgi:hypothetical protein